MMRFWKRKGEEPTGVQELEEAHWELLANVLTQMREVISGPPLSCVLMTNS